MDTGSTSTWAMVVISAIVALATGIWKMITIVSRIDHLEKHLEVLQQDIKDAKTEQDRLEDRICLKLDNIEKKLDDFIMNSVKS